LLELAEKELNDLLHQKKALDKSLANLESNIFTLESQYLDETATYGNIIKGFEGYLTQRSDRKRSRITEADRIFSQSSVSFKVFLYSFVL
jgi:chromatin modification-related protein EAF6